MSAAPRPERPPGPLTGLLDRLGAVLLTLVVGVVLGLQYITPNKRVLAVLVAIVIFGVTWRLDIVSGLGVLVLALPFPRTTVFGNTNLAFILLLLVTWLLRVTLGQNLPPRRTPIDAPLVTLFVCYVVSFYNIETMELLQKNLVSLEMIVATWLMYYLIVSNLRNSNDLGRMLRFQAVSVLLICLVGVFEVTHPGEPLIRGWISFTHPEDTLGSFRVGSVFYDYELLCEFCALSALLVLFLLVRANSLLPRLAYGGLLLLIGFVMFTTVTRGGIIALGIGVLYLLWMVRRRLTVVGTTIVAGAVAASIMALNWFVSTKTPTGDLFARVMGTTMIGAVPETRAIVWAAAWERIFHHPFIGHGPWYTVVTSGRIYYWPHSVYLYIANNVGFIGLSVFFWLLWTLFRISRPRTDDLRHPDLAQGYLLIARAQMIVFVVDQIKVEYLRYDFYMFQVWLMFALMVAAYQMVQEPGETGAASRAGLPGGAAAAQGRPLAKR